MEIIRISESAPDHKDYVGYILVHTCKMEVQFRSQTVQTIAGPGKTRSRVRGAEYRLLQAFPLTNIFNPGIPIISLLSLITTA